MSEVNLKGFILKTYFPSEEQLMVTIDCSNLPPNLYFALIRELQDTLSIQDEIYAEKFARARSLRARHKRIHAYGEVQRKRILKFSPFPMRFSNEISYLRQRLYDKIHDYCIIVQQMKSGKFERNLYLLPEDLAEQFVNEVEQLNTAIEELNRKVQQYNLSEVEAILNKYNLTLPIKNFSIPKLQIDLTPVRFDAGLVEEWAERSPTVAQLLGEKRKEIITKVVEDLKRRLEPIFKGILKERKMRKIKQRLEHLKQLAEAVGLKSLSETVITPLIEASENPEILETKYNTPKKQFLESRISSLLRSL